jgi:hypothetical protein
MTLRSIVGQQGFTLVGRALLFIGGRWNQNILRDGDSHAHFKWTDASRSLLLS